MPGPIRERQSAPPPPPGAFDERTQTVDSGLQRQHRALKTGEVQEIPAGQRGGMEQATRFSEPPAPPPMFHTQTNKVNPGLSAEHLRLKPGERGVRDAPTGIEQVKQYVPPVNHFASQNMAVMPSPAQAVNNNWPAMRFHPTKAPEGLIVKNAEHEREVCVGDGWVKNPSQFPPTARKMEESQATELLRQVIDVLSDQCEDGEDCRETLMRIIAERDKYAREITKLLTAEEKPSGTRKGRSSEHPSGASVPLRNATGG